MNRYVVTETQEDAFGITLEDEDGNALDTIEDITGDRVLLERMVETFNRYQLMPECFHETIGNLIGILL